MNQSQSHTVSTNVQLSCSPRGHDRRRHDDLMCSCMICTALPCTKLTCMISADLVPISHVSSSHQLARVLHVVITVAVIGRHVDSAVQRALLERDELIDVMALTERGGRTIHALARPSRDMHAE